MSTFADAKAAAARQGANLDASQREAVESGEQYVVTVNLEPDLSGFTAALKRLEG